MNSITKLFLLLSIILHNAMLLAESKDNPATILNVNVLLNANGETALKAIGDTITSQFWQQHKNLFNYSGYGYSFYDTISNNKKKMIILLALSFYSAAHYRLIYLTKKLTESLCWSLWHNEKTLESLFAIPQHQLARELLTDIQRRYTTIDSPTDFVRPLIAFMEDVDKEIKQLIEYKNICEWLEKLYINRVFLIKFTLAQECDDRIKRLAYIKSTFLTWIAEYKLDKRKKEIETHRIKKAQVSR